MSYNTLSIDKSEALQLVHQQIESGEVLLKKGSAMVSGKSEDALQSQSRDIFALAFRQWADRTCSMLYKIFENSKYASDFEETDSGGHESMDPPLTPDREYPLKRQLKEKLDYLKSLFDSIDDLEKYEQGPSETGNASMSGHTEKPSGYIEKNISAESIELTANPEKVFVVHGRNTRLNDDFFAFLRALHMEPIGWTQIISETGAGPCRDDLATIILMTPDDLVIEKHPPHYEDTEADKETPFSQPGADVLFAGGLALGKNPQRTVIVKIGPLKPFSALYEEQVLYLDNSTFMRQEVANRLSAAGCKVNAGSAEWLSVGNFQMLPAEEETSTDHTEATENNSPINAIMDIPDFSNEAMQLLTEAVQDESCTLSIIVNMGGSSIITNGKIFGIGGKKVSWDAWNAALHELIDNGLIQDADHRKQSFLITHKGYHVARALSKKIGPSKNKLKA